MNIFGGPAVTKMAPRFSLVLATVGRVALVERFLQSVVGEEYANLEVLVADQNGDDRLAPVLNRFGEHVAVRHLRVPGGLSRARNLAIRHVTGDVVAFPDDDCVYPPGLLESVAQILLRHPRWGGVAGCPVAEETGIRFRGFDERPRDLDARNVWTLSSSIGLFLRTQVVKAVGGFDETLGVGSGTAWAGAEDRDYALRAIDLGVVIRYDPAIRIGHPAPDYRDFARAHQYGAALGRVLRKRSATASELLRLVVIRPSGAIVLSLLLGRWNRAYFYLQSLRGRISGWRAPIA